MKFTDIFIRRPVLASVISLLILMLGLAAFFKLPVRQYPKVQNTIITVTTKYPGANAETVKGFITVPLSQAISSADGIDYMTSTTTQGLSVITAYIRLNFSPDEAVTNITSKLNAVLYKMPPGSTTPSILKQTGNTFPVFVLGFMSDTLNQRQISAYIANVVRPNIYGVGGISQLQLWGGKTYAMRIWLNPQRMADLGITSGEVTQALQNNNVQSTPGQLEGSFDLINLQATTDLRNVSQFDNMVVKSTPDRLIRLKDIGYAELGSKTYNEAATYDGKKAVFLTVRVASGVNPLTVVSNIRKLLPSLKKNFPTGLKTAVAYDATTFVRESIKEVRKSIIEAVIIVVLVIFLFLGALRSVVIPVLTIPLALIGVCLPMLMLGFSLNLLTLLAMILAIGLVVDDAIVVLENIYRHIEEGETSFKAAILGARQIATSVIVMGLTLAAVFAPIGFIGGLTGALFSEFAFTLAAAVIISSLIALTFSPMLCSKLINQKLLHGFFVRKIDSFFSKLKNGYKHMLHAVLHFYRPGIILIAIAVLGSCYFLYSMTPSELAPQEDQSFLGVAATAPVSANLDYLKKYGAELRKIFLTIPGIQATYTAYGFPQLNMFIGGLILKPWSERSETEMQLIPLLQKKASQITGMEVKAFERPTLPGTPFGPPVNFVITSTASYQSIYTVLQKLQQKAQQSGLFLFATGDLLFNNPQLNVNINRAKAAVLGIDMRTISDTLSTFLSENYTNYFSKLGYSFQVIPQVSREYRTNIQSLENYNIKTGGGKLVPLGSVVSFSRSTQPSQLTQFQQLNSATLQGLPMPGVSMGAALKFLQTTADQTFPKNISYDYSGASRQYMTEGKTIMYAFGLAIVVVFLLLSAKFESFRDPFVILFGVPMSIFGALLPFFLGAGTINIYSQIGLVTLIGLITKHGILMIDFANQLQQQGLTKLEAIEEAASIRLRPILMTTAAMVFAVLPLVFATGAGAVSRNNIGMVIAFGMAIGTCFTLFVVPTLYSYIGSNREKAVGSSDSDFVADRLE